jgi:hypothetical protein
MQHSKPRLGIVFKDEGLCPNHLLPYYLDNVGNNVTFMFRKIKLNFKMMVLSSLAALLSACTDGPVEMPGNLSNAKLVELINASLQEDIKRMDPRSSPGFIPQAAANARLWLKDIGEVVARCRYGPRNRSKFNLLEYDITLGNGEIIKDVYTGMRCSYEVGSPLVMRVRFESGQVADVLTDGRERNSPVDAAKGEINLFSKQVIRVDWDRHRPRYFNPAKTADEISNEWNNSQR